MKSDINIVKVDSCQSISGKSTLTYNIGCNDKSEVLFRVHANTGGGYFSKEWIASSEIQHALEKTETPITSTALQPLFRGKSTNTPAFLMAVLIKEGLVKKDKQRHLEFIGTNEFMVEIKKLISLKSESAKQAITKKSSSSTKNTVQAS